MPSNSWANGWINGDIPSAAEFAKGMGAIFDTTLGAGAASIDLASIVGSYAHLLIVAYLRSDTAATDTPVLLRFNGDSAANYSNSSTTGDTSIVAASAQGAIPAASTTAGVFGPCFWLIPHYAGTANQKSVVYSVGNPKAGATGHQASGTGVWGNTAAVNRVTISASAGNIVTGSRLSIYVLGS